MRLNINDGQLQTVEQVRQFMEGSEAVEFEGLTTKEKYCKFPKANMPADVFIKLVVECICKHDVVSF